MKLSKTALGILFITAVLSSSISLEPVATYLNIRYATHKECIKNENKNKKECEGFENSGLMKKDEEKMKLKSSINAGAGNKGYRWFSGR